MEIAWFHLRQNAIPLHNHPLCRPQWASGRVETTKWSIAGISARRRCFCRLRPAHGRRRHGFVKRGESERPPVWAIEERCCSISCPSV